MQHRDLTDDGNDLQEVALEVLCQQIDEGTDEGAMDELDNAI